MIDGRTQLLTSLRAQFNADNHSLACSRVPWFRRITVPLRDDVCILGWLSRQTHLPQIYWSARDNSFESAGLGVAHRILARGPGVNVSDDVFKLAGEILAGSDEEVRFFGGMAFGERVQGAGEWADFGDIHFIVPRLEVWRRDGKTFLSCHLRDNDVDCTEENVLGFIEQVVFDDTLQDGLLEEPVGRDDKPTMEGWSANVSAALNAFSSGELRKIVLARESIFDFPEPLHPMGLLNRLKRVTSDCFHFCVKFDTGSAFLGASPERLYAREGKHLASEAVAGTRPRGESPSADDAAARELMDSEKDQREHAFVREAIMAALEPLTRSVDIDGEPSLLKLARGQHLFSGIKGELKDNTSDGCLVGALHPTPAVGGTPSADAVARIAELEPFGRGWYAGPVGWISADAAEMAVAIRSALVTQNQLSLFSGAGIVEGSTAESEWLEIENKIADFINIITSP